MGKKILAGALLAGAIALTPAAAWADHCANFSRGAGNAVPWETVRGRWFFIATDLGSFWVFDTPDNFHDGRSDGLLDGSGACNASRLQGQTKGNLTPGTLKGIWSEPCVNQALGLPG